MYHQSKESDTYNQVSSATNVALVAAAAVFFALWFHRFANEPFVIEKLIDPAILPGVALNCFDTQNQYQLLPRNPNNLPDPI
jgi:hypothetical protein